MNAATRNPDMDLVTPQTMRVAHHLYEKGSISGVEASALYAVRSLTRRITDLRKLGFQLEGSWRKAPNGQRYKRYALREIPDWYREAVSD